MTNRHRCETPSTAWNECGTICSWPCFRKERNDRFPVSSLCVGGPVAGWRFSSTGPEAPRATNAIRDRPDSRCQLGTETTADALRAIHTGTARKTGGEAERPENQGPPRADARFARQLPVALRRTERQHRPLRRSEG